MKEIGSIYPIDCTYIPQDVLGEDDASGAVLKYSLCREALSAIATALSDNEKRVLIPAYTCQTVITPFIELGWECHYYGICKNLRIDLGFLTKQVEQTRPSLLVVHPYFGMDYNEEEIGVLQSISEKGVKIVLDQTQCLFSNQRLPLVDFYVGSYRKWFPIPDGGYLAFNKGWNRISTPEKENEGFVTRQSDAMYLRGLYFKTGDQKTKDISIRLSKSADTFAESTIRPHRMSAFSVRLKQRCEEQEIQRKRLSNYAFLFNNIIKSEKYYFVCDDLEKVTTAPLYFPLYVKDRRALQKVLIENRIYAPVIWPVEDERVLVSDDVRFIYEHLLAVPCDQRYDEADMQRVVEVINCF